MRLTQEQEKMVLDNQKLVHWALAKYNIFPSSSLYEDNFAVGLMGLVKAAITFDASKKKAFSTYAVPCIRNEIFMLYRREKRHNCVISMETPIGGDEDDLTLGMLLEDPKSNFVNEMVEHDEFIRVLSYILNSSDNKVRLILLYRMAKMRQDWIAKQIKISQSYVSRVEKKAVNKLRKFLQFERSQIGYIEVSDSDEGYKITFYTSGENNFNSIFSKVLINIAQTAYLEQNDKNIFEMIPNFKISYAEEEVNIWIPCCPESFIFLAEIFKEIGEKYGY